jgi:hypothetical protein
MDDNDKAFLSLSAGLLALASVLIDREIVSEEQLVELRERCYALLKEDLAAWEEELRTAAKEVLH